MADCLLVVAAIPTRSVLLLCRMMELCALGAIIRLVALPLPLPLIRPKDWRSAHPAFVPCTWNFIFDCFSLKVVNSVVWTARPKMGRSTNAWLHLYGHPFNECFQRGGFSLSLPPVLVTVPCGRLGKTLRLTFGCYLCRSVYRLLLTSLLHLLILKLQLWFSITGWLAPETGNRFGSKACFNSWICVYVNNATALCCVTYWTADFRRLNAWHSDHTIETIRALF